MFGHNSTPTPLIPARLSRREPVVFPVPCPRCGGLVAVSAVFPVRGRRCRCLRCGFSQLHPDKIGYRNPAYAVRDWNDEIADLPAWRLKEIRKTAPASLDITPNPET